MQRTAVLAFDKCLVYSSFPIWKLVYKGKTFEYEHAELPYFIAHYNATWRNERIIEIPIVEQFLRSRRGPGLEIGNVLSHYRTHDHSVIDLYEEAPGVLNIDVVDYRPPKPLGWIVMLSTLEHVGWGEEPGEGLDVGITGDADKIHRAVQHLRASLAPDGRMLVTSPRGYNPYLDAAIEARSLSPTRETFMVRSSGPNEWQEQRRDAALTSPPYYDLRRRCAYSLWIAEFSAPGSLVSEEER